MLRVHFAAADLARVRLRDTLGPLAETVFALRALQSPRDAAWFGEWRRRVVPRLSPAAVAVATALIPPGPAPIELFALIDAGPAASVEEGLETLRRTPAGRLGPELRSGRSAVEQLIALLAAGYAVGIAPYWSAMRAYLEAERATRARILAAGGVGRLFATLHPALGWRPPVLELADRPRDTAADLHLGGRGVDVVPSVFCRGAPEAYLPDDGGPMVLIYPAEADPATVARLWEPAADEISDGLSHLLGPTRAAVLAALADGRTTGELARRLRISPASASQHATVLRRAGLSLSTRQGNSVLHTLTPLGAALLDGWLISV